MNTKIGLARSIALLMSGAGVACGTAQQDGASAPDEGGKLYITFEANVNPQAGTMTIVKAEGYKQTASGLAPVVVFQDNVPGSGPSDTVELVTESTGFNGTCGFANSFCGNVRVRSFF